METDTLSDDEREAVKNFWEEIGKIHIDKDPNNFCLLSSESAIRFLMARKFDVRRALELFASHENVRQKENLQVVDPHDEAVRRELFTEKLTILPSRDNNGAAIALFTARLHHPNQTTHQAVLKALVFQLDVALNSVETQRNGLIFIYDMMHSRYQNFDYDLSIKILSMLKGSYPARLKKVLIVTAPLWFKAPFKILRVFVREKLRERVHTVNEHQLTSHIPLASLPKRFGGTLELDHRAWLSHCLQMAWKQSPNIDMEISTYLEPMSNHSDIMNCSLSSSASTTTGDDLTLSDWDLNDSRVLVRSREESMDYGDEVKHDWNASLNSPTTPFSPSKNSSSARKRSAEVSPNVVTSNGVATLLPHKKRPSSSDSPENTTSTKESIHEESRHEESIHMPDPSGLTIRELMEYCKIKGQKGLVKEYVTLKAEPPQGTFEISKSKVNMPKNRYTDVLCLDETRVKLSSTTDPPSDYINANFVDGYKQKNAYISTQGPLPKTFADFWQMIWEQKVLLVVMTTKTIERSRIKCGQYWPLDEQAIENFGNFAVINNGVSYADDHIVTTTLLLQNLEIAETREVTHIQFTGWPDYGVPHSAEAFLSFMFYVRQKQAERVAELELTVEPPIVVHCSAGIGRTGTFMTMDINTRMLANTGRVGVQKTVRKIRSQRAFSIQMPDQYVFCYTALIEHAQQQGLLPDVDLYSFSDSSSEESE